MQKAMNKTQKDPITPKHADGNPAHDWVIFRHADNKYRREHKTDRTIRKGHPRHTFNLSQKDLTLMGLTMATTGLITGISILWALGVISTPLGTYNHPTPYVSTQQKPIRHFIL